MEKLSVFLFHCIRQCPEKANLQAGDCGNQLEKSRQEEWSYFPRYPVFPACFQDFLKAGQKSVLWIPPTPPITPNEAPSLIWVEGFSFLGTGHWGQGRLTWSQVLTSVFLNMFARLLLPRSSRKQMAGCYLTYLVAPECDSTFHPNPWKH